MQKDWNLPTHYTKHTIDESIQKLIDNRTKTQLTSIILIDMLKDDDECKHMAGWYAEILQAILDGDRIDYPEKEEFLIFHKSLLDVYRSEQK